SAPKREITSLALDRAGNTYLAAAGEKRSGGGAQPNVAIALPAPSPAPGPAGSPQVAGPPPESTVTVNSSSAAVPGGSEIYRISPDGSPERLWSSRDDLVYALAFDQK